MPYGYFGDDDFNPSDMDYDYADGMNSDIEELERDDDRDDYDDYDDNYTDVEADADTLASAGYGTDEDYDYYGEAGYGLDYDFGFDG